MGRVDISEAEILEELRQAFEGNNPDDAFTTADLSNALDLSQRVVRKRLKPLVESGRVEPLRIRRPRMDGIMNTVTAYRVVEDEAA